MDSPSPLDAVIIGAGPVGLTAAIALHNFGLRFRILDRKPGPVQHSNALGVSVRTLEVFECLGLKSNFSQVGYAFPAATFHAFGKILGPIELQTIGSPYRGMHAIPQNVTESVLAHACADRGITVEYSIEATSVAQDANGCTVSIAPAGSSSAPNVTASAQIHARYVIGCEGSNSLCRNAMQIPFEGHYNSSTVFLQSDCHLSWSRPAGQIEGFLQSGEACIAFPYDLSGRHRIICAIPDADPSDRTPPTLDQMQALVRRLADPTAVLTDSIWLSRFRTQHRVAKTFRSSRVFLAGDAAHVHPPIGGQGMNTGIQDAFNLCWKIAAVIAHPENSARADTILDTYTTERHAVAQELLTATDTAFHALFDISPLKQAAFAMLAPALLKSSAMQHRIAATLAQINIAYAENPLVAAHAGHRAPDAELTAAANNSSASLFEILNHAGYTLLCFTGTHADSQSESWRAIEQLLPSLVNYTAHAGPDAHHARGNAWLRIAVIAPSSPLIPEAFLAHTFLDADFLAHKKYSAGSSAELILVRPDWYTALRTAADNPAPLHAHLATALGLA
jgi:3-(3-hydroxy-phenyl)propionate hydroxylase